jgi:hypothetical protein
VSFAIAFTSGSAHGGSSHRRFGELTLGEHQEEFLSSLDAWQEADYERHWRDAVTRLVFHEDTSRLVTSVDARRVTWFALRREGDDVVVRAERGTLDPADPFGPAVGEGHHLPTVFEWTVPVADVRRFLEAGA